MSNAGGEISGRPRFVAAAASPRVGEATLPGVAAPSSVAAPRHGRDEARPSQARPHVPVALRDAALATAMFLAAIAVGSGGFASVDPALLGYLGALVVAVSAIAWRVSAFWRRPASAFYARALLAALRQPRQLHRTLAHAGRDLAAQDFIRQRSTARWLAHLLLAFGTLASFAVTVPLVCGWMFFAPAGDRHYRMIVATLPTLRFAVDGSLAWLLFHALSLAAAAVVLGAAYFLGVRLRARRLPGATDAVAIAPLLVLLAVALTGLALPMSRGWPAAFRIAAWLHEVAVIVLLVALPFSKLAHLLIRPLQLGARAVRDSDRAWRRCAGCAAPLAPAAQQRAVAALLAARGIALDERVASCPACRRRQLAAAQAGLVGAQFQPRLVGARPAGER